MLKISSSRRITLAAGWTRGRLGQGPRRLLSYSRWGWWWPNKLQMFWVLHPTLRVRVSLCSPSWLNSWLMQSSGLSLLNCWDIVCTTKPSQVEVLRTDHMLALCEDKFNGFADLWNKQTCSRYFISSSTHAFQKSIASLPRAWCCRISRDSNASSHWSQGTTGPLLV